MKKILSLLVVFFMFTVLVSGCGLNSNPPEYIKSTVIYQEGDGLVAYFVLADASGEMTTAEGRAYVSIYAIIPNAGIRFNSSGLLERCDLDEKIYSETIDFTNKDFKKTKVGIGAFEHEVILLPIKRIPYSKLNPNSSRGKMTITIYLETDTYCNHPLNGEIIFSF